MCMCQEGGYSRGSHPELGDLVMTAFVPTFAAAEANESPDAQQANPTPNPNSNTYPNPHKIKLYTYNTVRCIVNMHM